MFSLSNSVGSATLDDGLQTFTSKLVEAATVETLKVLQTAAEGVAGTAGASWYGTDGVTRRTGTSGTMATSSDVTSEAVRVTVGSVDLAKAKYVHRPGPLSVIAQEITRDEYYAAKRKKGAEAKLVFHSRRDRPDEGVKAGLYYRSVPNPKASDGKYLLQEFVGKPGRQAMRDAAPLVGAAIARVVGGGR